MKTLANVLGWEERESSGFPRRGVFSLAGGRWLLEDEPASLLFIIVVVAPSLKLL